MGSNTQSVDTSTSAASPMQEMMRGWSFTQAGLPAKILKRLQLPTTPTLPETSLRVRVSYVALHPGSVILMNVVPMMFRRAPSIPETDFSGTVIAVGSKVPTTPDSDGDDRFFSVGTEVFGSIPVPVHLKGSGALAEYVVIDMDSVARKPPNVPLNQAAGLSVSAITAMDVVDLAGLQPGQKVLINSPCGGVGSFATQMIRKAVGSTGKIIGICGSANAQRAMKLGCDETIDYHTNADGHTIVAVLKSRFSGDQSFDVVVDCHGSQELWHATSDILKAGKGHNYATVGPKFSSYSVGGVMMTLWHMFRNMCTPTWAGGVNRNYKQAASFINAEKLARIKAMAEDGSIRTEIKHSFAFEDALEAYQTLISGHAQGKVIIRMDES